MVAILISLNHAINHGLEHHLHHRPSATSLYHRHLKCPSWSYQVSCWIFSYRELQNPSRCIASTILGAKAISRLVTLHITTNETWKVATWCRPIWWRQHLRQQHGQPRFWRGSTVHVWARQEHTYITSRASLWKDRILEGLTSTKRLMPNFKVKGRQR